MDDGEYGNDNLFCSTVLEENPREVPIHTMDLQTRVKAIHKAHRTSIVGAVKLTGKTQDGLSVGFMNAVTSSEVAEIDTGGHKSEQIVEPLTNYLGRKITEGLQGRKYNYRGDVYFSKQENGRYTSVRNRKRRTYK